MVHSYVLNSVLSEMVMIASIFLQQEEFYFCENVSTPPGVLFCRSHYVCWYFHVWIICLRSPQNSCDCVCNPVVWNQSEHVSHGSVQPASSPPASKVIKPSSSSPWTDHGSLSPLTLELELWWSLVGSLVCCCQQVAGSILRFSVQSFHVLPVCVCVVLNWQQVWMFVCLSCRSWLSDFWEKNSFIFWFHFKVYSWLIPLQILSAVASNTTPLFTSSHRSSSTSLITALFHPSLSRSLSLPPPPPSHTHSISHTYRLPARSLLLSDRQQWAMDCSYESDVCPSSSRLILGLGLSWRTGVKQTCGNTGRKFLWKEKHSQRFIDCQGDFRLSHE